MSRYLSGLEGEKQAEAYLSSRGFTVLERRFRSGHLEVDLIAGKAGILYFVEVKHRPDSRLGSGITAITREKREHLKAAMKAYRAPDYHARQLAYLEITRAGILLREDVLHEN